jgi:S-adenosylmethionine hydrolase
MAGIITLTTDFGLTDGYVAAMKGVILGINRDVTLVDICHNIKPQNIAQAAFVLSTAYPFFPPKTIHVVVVDPGVGTERKAVVLRTPQADFIAPDNGVLSYAIRQFSKEFGDDIRQIALGPELEAVALTEPRFWRSPVSPTFHGRDILAPVAALLSMGFPPVNFGERLSSLAVLPLSRPHQAADGSLGGHIIHIDAFGNLVTDVKGEDLRALGESVSVRVGDQVISGLSRTYAEGRGLLALIGSSGYLEVSLKGGSAQALLDARVGGEVRIRRE